MNVGTRAIEKLGGRRVVLGLGVFYLVAALPLSLVPIAGETGLGEEVVITSLVGIPGLVLLYLGYRLSHSEILPELYPVVARWCLGAIGVMLGILLFIAVVATLTNPVQNALILTALSGVAGLGMGYHDGRARTRARIAERQREEAVQQREKAERRRKEAERYGQELERYERIVETANDGIFVVDEDQHFTLVNRAYAEILGYDRQDLVGMDSMQVVEGDATIQTAQIRDNLATGGDENQTYEATLVTASGGHVEAEATFALLPENQGGGRDLVGVVRDVTERNEREARLAEQNERLDNFASMLAHELRNPVMIGQIYLGQLPTEEAPEAVGHVTDAFDRIEHMVDVLLLLTRGAEVVSERESVALAPTARSAWTEVEAPEARLNLDSDTEILADETYVQHLFRNLFDNAVRHGGADVSVTVGDLPTGFFVEDDGPGIAVDDQDRVFTPGYTTTGEYGGSGLGLAFVQELADSYEWTTTVTESESGGARFEFENVTTAQTQAG